MADSMTLDQQAALQAVVIDIANKAKVVRYFNLASVSRPFVTTDADSCLFPHRTVALLYI